MATHKIYVITDLGPGDGGKGGVVNKVVSMNKPHTVIKGGGAQGSHGVVTSRGERFAFSQWGCGTLEGVPTFLSSRFVVAPELLQIEAEGLRAAGISDPFSMLTIDSDALCSTPYDRIASRLKEMSLRDKPRGTVGTGVGEAYRRNEAMFGRLSVRAHHLNQERYLREVIGGIRQRLLSELNPIINGRLLDDDREAVAEEVFLLREERYVDYIVDQFLEVGRLVKVVHSGYLGDRILTQDGCAVVENSHGVLTDRYWGFDPHVSALRTLPRFTKDMLSNAGYNDKIVNLAVHRAYSIRHGAGPLPTADPEMDETLLPGSHKLENRYQGKVRVGPLDLKLLTYAIEVCGGPSAFDGLAITWFDQIQFNGVWQYCDNYGSDLCAQHFTNEGNIRPCPQGREDSRLITNQQQITEHLFKDVHPKISNINISPDATQDELFIVCAELMEKKVKVPVRMVSFGSTEQDKLCK